MFSSKFGLEVEFTGITRGQAAQAAAKYLGGTIEHTYDSYDTIKVTAPDGRVWKFMSDGSILCKRVENNRAIPATGEYSVEMVSPILTYHEDIETVQSLARRLRKAGAFTNSSCGIHVHLDGSGHTPRSIWNFVNLIASRNDLFYKALQISGERTRYCKKMDAYLVERLNREKPRTFEQLEQIWYAGYSQSRYRRYHESRYHFLNLHSFFHGSRTVELRGFNSTLHAGKIRAYIVFALAMNHQALTQKSARYHKVQEENEKFAMRVFLNRIGFIGEEYKSCREHLYKHLSGNAAWRYGSRENVSYHVGQNSRQTEEDGECGA